HGKHATFVIAQETKFLASIGLPKPDGRVVAACGYYLAVWGDGDAHNLVPMPRLHTNPLAGRHVQESDRLAIGTVYGQGPPVRREDQIIAECFRKPAHLSTARQVP